jgi:hypothetical protein
MRIMDATSNDVFCWMLTSARTVVVSAAASRAAGQQRNLDKRVFVIHHSLAAFVL